MDIAALPFCRLIGLEAEPAGSGYLLALPAGECYGNHLGSIHAGALMALAESATGEFLFRRFGDGAGYVPVVRRMAAKFRKPAQGRVSARVPVAEKSVAQFAVTLEHKGRASIELPVEVLDEQETLVLSAEVEWFVACAAGQTDPSEKP
jgi:acyl-coenzyme A thioesterase PaaI-like protein